MPNLQVLIFNEKKGIYSGQFVNELELKGFSIHTTLTYFNLMKFNCEQSHPKSFSALTYYPHNNGDFAPQLPKFA